MKPGSIIIGSSALVVLTVGASLWLYVPTTPVSTTALAQVHAVDFNRDVRPILSDHCFACHGPDADKGRKAGLRLDTPEGALALLKSDQRAIVPGDIDASALIARIHHTDDEEVMPPPDFKRPLTSDQKKILTQWIAQGGRYAKHWAFVKPQSSPPPKVKLVDWARDPIDTYILATMEKTGLSPAEEADRATLLRRVSFVLTGLPPTPEETEAFIADTSPNAYERQVDRLLASKRFAEHAAVTWLDLARYADTAGYSGDPEMPVSPWRDWLLNTIDRNLPYDQFITWQVAGDLLPNATTEQRLATAFNRLHRVTFEGGSIAEEMRQESISDRVATFGFAFTALTMECAKCHDHKYDPIPQRDFYALSAMFSDIDENGLLPYHGAVPVPVLRLTNAEQNLKIAELQKAVDVAQQRFDECQRIQSTAAVTVSAPTPDAHYSFEILEKGSTPNRHGKPATTQRHRADQLGKVAVTNGKVGNAIAFDGDGGLWLDGLSGFSSDKEFTFSTWIKAGERNQRAVLLHASGFYTNDADATGLELMIDQGRVSWSCIQQWPGSAIAIRSRKPLAQNTWVLLTVTYNGLSRASGLRIYLNGQRAESEVLRDHLTGPVGGATLELGSRSRDSGFRDGIMDEVKIWRTELTAAEVAQLAETKPDAHAVAEHNLFKGNAAYLQARNALRTAQQALRKYSDSIPVIVTMAQTTYIRPTYILQRGAYDQPDLKQPVSPGAVEAVLPFSQSLPANRLGLARWLTSPENPLTARVAVNRLWMQVFGQGLVHTPENFGVQGDAPTHPELLDQLAIDFQKVWDTKALLRRLVLSASFRQSSIGSEKSLTLDPKNVLLSRGPTQRLSAEMLRDQALYASGMLVEKFGGRSHSGGSSVDEYKSDPGESNRRRSVYTYRKRTMPPPSQQIFDAGSREVCQVRRLTTNTPLQALVLLNEPIYVECARGLAERSTREAQDTTTRIGRAFKLICGRTPRPTELATLTELYNQQRLEFSKMPEEARKVCGKVDAELAALTLVCSTLMASDAAITLR